MNFPSSGDRGFAPLEYEHVDPVFGDWGDIERLSQKYYLMCDFMINHISAHSRYYLDFLQNKDASPWKDLFIRYRDFWQDGEPTAKQVDAIYKRKPRAPYTTAHFADGSQEKVWCTFGEEQIDLNLQSKTGQKFVEDTLKTLCGHGVSLLRLDAVGYVTKKAGTSCFFVEPEIWDVLANVNHIAESFGSLVLPEVHEHYSMPLKIAQHGYYVYDFALPMLLLHAIYYGQSQYLKHWFSICPRHQFTTLDTHDGIGVVDVKDLLPDEEIEKMGVREIELKSGGSIVIDKTEALTAIDVNTGKYVGNSNLAETAYRTNLEAAEEILRQVRLRDIGGIIIIDFIDMEEARQKEALLEYMRDQARQDRTKTNIVDITSLGLVEMTRKKSRQNFESILYSECPCCHGRGRIESPETVSINISRDIRCMEQTSHARSGYEVEVHPQVAGELERNKVLERLERELGTVIRIVPKKELHPEGYSILLGSLSS